MKNKNVYVGHRYVPKIMGEHDKSQSYEGLSIVTHEGTSYTSKKHVPIGVDILNTDYWVVTGNYNAQVENYRDEVGRVQEEIRETKSYVNDEVDKLTGNLNDRLDENNENLENYKKNETFKGNRFAGHRGTGYAPENTIVAFETAKKMGFKVVETDLMLTSDNVPVIFHDNNLDRMTNGIGLISDHTLQQIKELDIVNGENIDNFPTQKIPTLDEFLSWCRYNNMFVVLELKTTFTRDIIMKIHESLRKYKMVDKTIVISYIVSNLEKYKSLDSSVPLALVTNNDINQSIIDTVLSIGIDGISPYRVNLTKAGVDLAHMNNLFVMVWNVNTLMEAKTLISDFNVDYITSDYVSEAIFNESN